MPKPHENDHLFANQNASPQPHLLATRRRMARERFDGRHTRDSYEVRAVAETGPGADDAGHCPVLRGGRIAPARYGWRLIVQISNSEVINNNGAVAVPGT